VVAARREAVAACRQQLPVVLLQVSGDGACNRAGGLYGSKPETVRAAVELLLEAAALRALQSAVPLTAASTW
jgi:hypothetical protein